MAGSAAAPAAKGRSLRRERFIIVSRKVSAHWRGSVSTKTTLISQGPKVRGGQRFDARNGRQLNLALLPAPPLVGFPIGHVETILLGIGPARAGVLDGIGVGAVEEEHDPLVGASVGRHWRAVQKETHQSPVGIFLVDGQENGLPGGLRVAPDPVRQKALLAKGPKPGIERFDSLL